MLPDEAFGRKLTIKVATPAPSHAIFVILAIRVMFMFDFQLVLYQSIALKMFYI